jgi:hypothetical protein
VAVFVIFFNSGISIKTEVIWKCTMYVNDFVDIIQLSPLQECDMTDCLPAKDYNCHPRGDNPSYHTLTRLTIALLHRSFCDIFQQWYFYKNWGNMKMYNVCKWFCTLYYMYIRIHNYKIRTTCILTSFPVHGELTFPSQQIMKKWLLPPQQIMEKSRNNI